MINGNFFKGDRNVELVYKLLLFCTRSVSAHLEIDFESLEGLEGLTKRPGTKNGDE